MQKPLTLDDIDQTVRAKVYTQKYGQKAVIDGVMLTPLTSHIGDEGDFSEIIRCSGSGEVEGLPGFSIKQINRTRLLPGSIKAWHLHYGQDECWYVPPAFHLFVGLWDIRKGSPTNSQKLRLSIGGGLSHLLFIPRGVAHGLANHSGRPVELFYFVSNTFQKESPDEQRLPWDSAGADFWQSQKE